MKKGRLFPCLSLVLLALLLIGYTTAFESFTKFQPATDITPDTAPLSHSFDDEKFQQFFFKFKREFNPENFALISPPDELVIQSSSLTQNIIDKKKIDAVNEQINKPSGYELYYKNNTTNILVKINFIYFPDNHSTSFVALNSINFIDEYLLSYDGFLVLMTYIDIDASINTMVTENKQEKMNLTMAFFNDYERKLDEIAFQ